MGVEIQALEDSPEPHALGIEYPGAVTGLEDEEMLRVTLHK